MRRAFLAAAVILLGIVVLDTVPFAKPVFAPALPFVPSLHEEQPIKILFVGDVMLDRYVALRAKNEGDDALVAGVQPLFEGHDAIVINHEGTITTNQSVATPQNLNFTFDPHFTNFLKGLGVTAASLSNNHTEDFGESGYQTTKKYLADAGIATFGSPDNARDLSTVLTVRDKKVCLVGYESFIRPDPTPIAEEITRIRPSCDLLVATMHAGVEYSPGFALEQSRAARSFIDAGADLVIGTHPHVVEPLEIYKGKAIFYSLGNFIFDQDFSFETMHGLAVSLSWTPAETKFTLIPVAIAHQKLSFPSSSDKTLTLRALLTSSLPAEITTSIASSSTFTLP